MVTTKSTISADVAKGHFDEVLLRVENNEEITIERDGEPRAVIVSVDEYQRLKASSGDNDERWRSAIKRSSDAITRATGGKRIDWNKIIDDMRDDRSEQLLENLR